MDESNAKEGVIQELLGWILSKASLHNEMMDEKQIENTSKTFVVCQWCVVQVSSCFDNYDGDEVRAKVAFSNIMSAITYVNCQIAPKMFNEWE
jgi:hypothetical protein